MIASHYDIMIFDNQHKPLAVLQVFSFEEALYWLDKFREKFAETACEFTIIIPNKEDKNV